MDELSVNLLGKVSIGKADVTANPALLERFTEHGTTPSIWHFRKGTMTPYHGPGNVEAMMRFTSHGHKLEGGAMKMPVDKVAPQSWFTSTSFFGSLFVFAALLSLVLMGGSVTKTRSA